MNYLLGLAGIIVSVLTFGIGYRKTIGAQNEIINTSNIQLVSALTKHFATSKTILTRPEIEIIRSGQAQSKGVKPSRLLSMSSLRDYAALKVFENDYLSEDEKRNALDRIFKSFHVSSDLSPQGIAVVQEIERNSISKDSKNSLNINRLGALVLLGVASTAIPIAIELILNNDTALPTSFSTISSSPFVIFAVISSVLMVIFSFLSRHTTIEDKSHDKLSTLLNSHIETFSDVITKAGNVNMGEPDADFTLTLPNNKVILFECRFDAFKKDDKLLEEAVQRLEAAKASHPCDHAVLVVAPEVHKSASKKFSDRSIEVVSLFELRDYLEELAKQ